MDNKNFMEQEYAAFERAMNEERIYLRVSDYSEICALIGADPIGLDRVIYEELGWHGQAVVDFYALCENIHNSNFRKCETPLFFTACSESKSLPRGEGFREGVT